MRGRGMRGEVMLRGERSGGRFAGGSLRKAGSWISRMVSGIADGAKVVHLEESFNGETKWNKLGEKGENLVLSKRNFVHI